MFIRTSNKDKSRTAVGHQDCSDIQGKLKRRVTRNVTIPGMSIGDFLGGCRVLMKEKNYPIQHQSSRETEESLDNYNLYLLNQKKKLEKVSTMYVLEFRILGNCTC